MSFAAESGHVVAGDIITWINAKETAVKALVTPTLWLAAVFFALVAWVVSRSWKKAMVAGIGGAIIIAVVGQLDAISAKVGTEINGAPAVVRQYPPDPSLDSGSAVGGVWG
jgi:hypothetical protein